jgi:hypothetical protein
MHRGAVPSAGLHLFQELSTLGQQLTHALLLGQGCRRIKDRVSSTRTVTAPALPRGAVRCWHRCRQNFGLGNGIHQRADSVYAYPDLVGPLQREGIWRNDSGACEQEAAIRETVVAEKIFD